MSEELKPCPACGGHAIRIKLGLRHWCECEQCETRGPTARTAKAADAAWNVLLRQSSTAEFLAGLSLGAALTEKKAAQSSKLAQATRDMRDRQKAYFKHRGNMLLAEAKNAEADVDRLLADIFPAPKQGQLL